MLYIYNETDNLQQTNQFSNFKSFLRWWSGLCLAVLQPCRGSASAFSWKQFWNSYCTEDREWDSEWSLDNRTYNINIQGVSKKGSRSFKAHLEAHLRPFNEPWTYVTLFLRHPVFYHTFKYDNWYKFEFLEFELDL